MTQEKILLFIPVYNCERQIERVLQSLNQGLPEGIKEIIVVDNGSSDRTAEVVRSYVESFRAKSVENKEEIRGNSTVSIGYLRNRKNYGLGGSHKVAYQYALTHGFAGIITLHGDDQASLCDIKNVVEKWYHGQLLVDAILGSRFSSKSRNDGYALHRRLGNYLLNCIWSVVLLRIIPDIGSGLNFITTDIIKRIDFLNLPDSLVFNPQQLLALIRVKAKIVFFPIRWREQDQKSNAVPWKVFLAAVRQVLAYRVSGCCKKGSFWREIRAPRKEYFFDVVDRVE